MLTEKLLAYVKKEYGTVPEYPWASYPDFAVLRHKCAPGQKKAKWYGLIMPLERETLGLLGSGKVDVLNVKCDPEMLSFLLMADGYLPAYHMSKSKWVTILLDGTVPFENIKQQLQDSFILTSAPQAKKKMKKKRTGRKDWLVPANPKYYDLFAAFEENDIILWKQSSDIRPGDLVYMYAAAPYSAIVFKCKAVETDIPWNEPEMLNIKKMMRIQKLASYDADVMPLSRMKEEFGVYAVRGPRYLPHSLKAELTHYEGGK